MSTNSYITNGSPGKINFSHATWTNGGWALFGHGSSFALFYIHHLHISNPQHISMSFNFGSSLFTRCVSFWYWGAMFLGEFRRKKVSTHILGQRVTDLSKEIKKGRPVQFKPAGVHQLFFSPCNTVRLRSDFLGSTIHLKIWWLCLPSQDFHCSSSYCSGGLRYKMMNYIQKASLWIFLAWCPVYHMICPCVGASWKMEAKRSLQRGFGLCQSLSFISCPTSRSHPCLAASTPRYPGLWWPLSKDYGTVWELRSWKWRRRN